jgi:hypothetical protein
VSDKRLSQRALRELGIAEDQIAADAATPAPLDVHPGHVCFDHARYDGLRDWWDGLDDAEKREAYLVEKGNADALALAPSLLDVLIPVINKASAIQQRARRTAISNEDWRYANGYNDCLAAILSILDPDDALLWVRDPIAEAERQASREYPDA